MALADLPLDVHISICFFLDACGILSLGQTCSHLRTLTRERIVWTTTLQQACFKNHIPNATFQLHKMSLEDLQHAATAPSRILSKISLGKFRDPETEKPPVLPYRSQIILQASDLAPNVEGNHTSRFFRQFILAPGGRFLLAYSPDDVILFDLNRPDLQPPHVVARVSFPDEDYTFVSAPSCDGDEIRVALSRGVGTHIELCIVRFIFDSDTGVPTVKQHTTKLHTYEQSDTLPYTLVGDVFILLYDAEDDDDNNKRTTLFSWNFVEDRSVKWAVRREVYKEVFLDGERVILVTESSLQGYVLPPLRSKIDDAPIRLHAPLFCHSLLMDDFPERASPLCIRILDWYNTSETLSSFRFVVLPPAPGEEMIFLSVQSRSDRWDVDEPELKVSHPSLGCLDSDVTERPVDVGDISRCPFRLCNGYSVEAFFLNERCLVSSTSTSLPNDQTEAVFCGVELQTLPSNPFNYPLNHMRLSESFFVFDPFSGRLAYMTNSPDFMFHSKIVILDYLRTPEH